MNTMVMVLTGRKNLCDECSFPAKIQIKAYTSLVPISFCDKHFDEFLGKCDDALWELNENG